MVAESVVLTSFAYLLLLKKYILCNIFYNLIYHKLQSKVKYFNKSWIHDEKTKHNTDNIMSSVQFGFFEGIPQNANKDHLYRIIWQDEYIFHEVFMDSCSKGPFVAIRVIHCSSDVLDAVKYRKLSGYIEIKLTVISA